MRGYPLTALADKSSSSMPAVLRPRRVCKNVLRDEPSWAPYMRVFEFPLVELPVAQLSLN
jgi:hypothetical protein